MLKPLAITWMGNYKLPTHPVILANFTACAAIAMTFACRMGYVSLPGSMVSAEGFVGLFCFGEILVSVAKGPNDDKYRVARISHGGQSHVLQYAETNVCIEKQSSNSDLIIILLIDTYGGAEIYLCPNSTPSKWYCGSSNAGRCTSNTSNSTFSLPQGFFSDFRDYRCIATTSNPTSCSIQSLTPPKSADTSTSTANSPSSTPSLLQACQTSSALPASACANSKNTEIGIGVGVGIPLFVALVASLLFLFRERRLRKQLAIEPGVSNERG